MDYDDLDLLTPRRRRALGWIGAVAALLTIAAVALHLHGLSRLDELRRDQRRHGPSDPAAYAPPVAAAEHNALLAMVAAAEGVASLEEDHETLFTARRARPAAWPAETWAAVERHLAANDEPLAALHRAGALPGGGLGLDYGRFNPSTGEPPLDLASAARLLELEGLAAVAAGEAERAAAAIEALGRMGTLLHREPDSTLQILALSAGGAQLRVLRELVAAGAPPELLPRLERALERTADRAALARAIRRETAFLAGDDAGRTARAWGRHAGPFWHAASWVAGELLLVEGVAARAELARVDELPYGRLADAVRAASSDLPLGPFEMMTVNLQVTALRADATAASRQLAELALALAAAGARDGGYPAALPDHPAATTADPLTASLPSYRRAADGSARLALDAAEAKAGSEGGMGSVPFVWELPPPPPPT